MVNAKLIFPAGFDHAPVAKLSVEQATRNEHKSATPANKRIDASVWRMIEAGQTFY